MSVKQDRTYPRTASDLERKYNFGTRFAEIMGIATDARESVEKVESELRSEMEEQYSSFTRSTEEIRLEVSKITTSNEELQTEVDEELENIRQTIDEQNASIISDCNNIILEATQKYVETSNYEEFKQTLETELSVMSDQILISSKTTTEQIKEVNGDMQSKFTELYEWIRIAGGVMTFGSSDSAVTLSIENDNIVFRKNGNVFGSWDGDNFYTGNIVIKLGERFQLGDFAFKPRKDKSMMLVWVGE